MDTECPPPDPLPAKGTNSSPPPPSLTRWKFYSRARDVLEHGQRLENLSWRLMGMSLTGGTKTTKEMAGQPGPTEVHGGWDLTKEKALDLERTGTTIPKTKHKQRTGKDSITDDGWIHSLLSVASVPEFQTAHLSVQHQRPLSALPDRSKENVSGTSPTTTEALFFDAPLAPLLESGNFQVMDEDSGIAALLLTRTDSADELTNATRGTTNGTSFETLLNLPDLPTVPSLATLDMDIPTPTTTTTPPTLCSNCKASQTSLWRKSLSGRVVCNACGLFEKIHGSARPLSLKTNIIRKRNRGSKKEGAGVDGKSGGRGRKERRWVDYVTPITTVLSVGTSAELPGQFPASDVPQHPPLHCIPSHSTTSSTTTLCEPVVQTVSVQCEPEGLLESRPQPFKRVRQDEPEDAYPSSVATLSSVLVPAAFAQHQQQQQQRQPVQQHVLYPTGPVTTTMTQGHIGMPYFSQTSSSSSASSSSSTLLHPTQLHQVHFPTTHQQQQQQPFLNNSVYPTPRPFQNMSGMYYFPHQFVPRVSHSHSGVDSGPFGMYYPMFQSHPPVLGQGQQRHQQGQQQFQQGHQGQLKNGTQQQQFQQGHQGQLKNGTRYYSQPAVSITLNQGLGQHQRMTGRGNTPLESSSVPSSSLSPRTPLSSFDSTTIEGGHESESVSGSIEKTSSSSSVSPPLPGHQESPHGSIPATNTTLSMSMSMMPSFSDLLSLSRMMATEDPLGLGTEAFVESSLFGRSGDGGGDFYESLL